MSGSVATRAGNRAGRSGLVIRQALTRGDGYAAFNEAVRRLRAEAGWVRGRRTPDADALQAEVAGIILALAAGLHARKPAPGALADILADAFETALGGSDDTNQ